MNSQLINTMSIIIGGGLLFFQISGVDRSPYIMIVGLVLLMFGLYRATNYWVETKDDHKDGDGSEGDKNA